MSLGQSRADHRVHLEDLPDISDQEKLDIQGIDWNNNPDPLGMFSSRGMKPPELPSPQEVRRRAQAYSSKILQNYRLLHAIAERHEATIKKRWEKKKTSQRLAILRDAWGAELPAAHRPDFSVWRRNEKQLTSAAEKHRDAFMSPYINQEDLVKPRTLPLLLNARARNHPSSFAAADGEAMHLGKVTMAVVAAFLNQHVMLLNGITQDKEYGKLLEWDDHPDAFDWMHHRRQFLPGEGLLILEVQDHLMRFLVACCNDIMHDIPQSDLISDAYPVQPAPELKTGVDIGTGMMSLAVLAEEAPYRPPAELDFGKVHSLLAARTSRAEDHIWALREDPAYLAEQLYELKEHRQEMIKDVSGNLHPTLRPPRENLLWARIIGSLNVGAITQLEMFTELRDQAKYLSQLQQKFAKDISPQEPLPEPYLNAILKFRHYLTQMCKGPMIELKSAFAASPPMRSHFLRSVPLSLDSSKMNVTSKHNWKPNKIEQQVTWLMQTLWEDGQNLFLAGLPLVVDELDRLLKAEPEAAAMISSYVAMLFGELSILAECIRQVSIYQPWANSFEIALIDREEGIKNEFAQRFQTLGKVMGAMNDKRLVGISDFGDPSDNKFEYPVHKKRNKINVDKMREAEENLALLWDNLDARFRDDHVDLTGTALKNLLLQPRALQRTPEWTEPAVVNQKDGGSKAITSAAVDELYKPFSNLFIGEGTKQTSTSASKHSKSKVKTRGISTAANENAMPGVDPSASEPPDTQPTFKVDARALKVFRVVFFDPTANTTPGEVAWNDFLQAMVTTGFAAQKLYGSVWHFQPTELDVDRSIQFHEPHPKGKLPFVVARRYGRRLNRAYGWFGGMFVPK